MQRKETNDLKACNGWTQKWMSPHRIRKNKDLYVREIVRGPFSSPKLLVSQPIIALSSCQPQSANVNENCNNLRHGIPDAWKEYLVRKGFCNSIEARVLQKNLIPSCVRSFATDRIWNELGLPLLQGIPDPWKCKFLFQRRSVKCLRRRCAYNNKISAQITSIYDGDDEAEIEHNVKRQFNKNRVVNDTDLLRNENKELFSSQINKIALRKSENNLEKVKSNVSKHDDESSIDKNLKWTSQHGRPMRKFKNDFNTKKTQTINNTKNKKTFTQKNVIPTKEKLVKKQNVYTNTKNETENHLEKNVQTYSNVVCCNCTLPNYARPNFPKHANCFQSTNVSNLVLCQNCENIYYNRDFQQLNHTMKTTAACVHKPTNIVQCKTISRQKTDKRKKCKLSDCFKKGKTRFKQQNLIDKKSKICREQELKLVCGRCNNPYLKIVSFRANATDQKKYLCACKKEERNKIRNGISKHPMTRKQSNNIGRSSKNYLCTWTESKMYVSREDLGWTSCSIKAGNNVSKKNSYDDDVTISAMSSEIKVNPKNDNQTCAENRVTEIPEEKIIPKSILHSRSYIDGGKGKQLSEDNRYNVKKKTIRRANKNKTNTMVVEEKDNVKQVQQVRLNPTSGFVVSDSGEYADVSDNLIDDDTNVTSQDRWSVTSLSFMRRLTNTIPIRKLNRKMKLQKAYRFQQQMSRNNMLDFEEALKIEDNIMNDNNNGVDCDELCCSEFVQGDNSEI